MKGTRLMVCFSVLEVPVPVVSLNIYDVGPTTMHVQWQPVGGATGYILSYKPVKDTEPTTPKEVKDVCFFNIESSQDFIAL